MTQKSDKRRKAAATSKSRAAVSPHLQSEERRPARISRWLFAALLLVLTLALYWRVRGFPFINFDDDDYVVNNAHVTAGLTWATVRWSLTAMTADNWHPLTWLSHAADCQLFGTDAGGPHTVSVLLHMLNAWLLFFLLQAVTRKVERSFVVAALFAWHPLNVESVAWMSERKNILSTLLLLLCLLAYGWYAQKPRWQRYLGLTLVFALGLAAKSMLVTLPFVFLLLDFWPLRRIQGNIGPERGSTVPRTTWRLLLLEKLPLLALSAAATAVTVYAQRGGNALQSLQGLSLVARLETATRAYALYIVKAFWPSGLAIYYPNPFDASINQHPGAASYVAVVVGIGFLVAGSWLAWRYRQTKPYFVTGWFWYVITLLPVIGIVQVGAQGMADRYAYLPLIGLFVAGVWGGAEIGNKVRFGRPLLPIIATGVLGVLCAVTFRQISYWHSSYEVWQHARRVTSNNYVAADKIAVLLLHQRNPGAFQYYEEATRIAPWDPVSNEVVAALAASQGRMADAIHAYEVVIHGSDNPEVIALAYSNLGMIYTMQGDYERARSSAEQAMEMAPHRIEQEIGEMSASLVMTPDADGYLHLAMLLEQDGQVPAARSACKKAIGLSPSSTEARRFLDHLG